ncbi:site-2 protease family protein [Streptomyces europaeiscabiei]|uniref:site-2 protease family protein n=1 Tax=Streptomyces europaeiscabiei TaxID=146819 RepID=UPI0029B28B8F|nr:site-2 protease family protein [Streptomyces europaeiscabiei]MDX2525042.1 site-2 protease family protein [Streptomyces europaeiscabiei]MDX3844507.1 site-2 protease family protein [Streptomyces europaeiscabiei]
METSGGSGQPRSDSDGAPERAHRDATEPPAENGAPTPAPTHPTPGEPVTTSEALRAADAPEDTGDSETPDASKPTGATEEQSAIKGQSTAGEQNAADGQGATEHHGAAPEPTAPTAPRASGDSGPPAPSDDPAHEPSAANPVHRPSAASADPPPSAPPNEPPTDPAGRPSADAVDEPAANPVSEPSAADPETPADLDKAPADEPERTATFARPHAPSGAAPKPPQRPKDPGGGILMGRPFGVPVYVAPSWFLVAALITWVFGGQLDRVLPELGALRYLVALFFAVAFYASVLVHELAHTIAALRYKLPVRRIQLQFFGGVSEIEKESETPGREFVLAFVGPLLSLILAGIFYVAMLAVEPGTVPGVLLAGLMISNLIVAAFNLLPGLPLDGGRMLRAVVWKITGKPMTGTIAAAWVGRALAVSVLIGLPLLTQSGLLGSAAEDSVGMDTVLDALLAAILAAIIWTGAGNSLRMARLREHLPELQARALTRRAVPVETDTPLSEALRRANEAGARALVIVDLDGEPVSLVREAAIVGVPEHRRPWVAVSGLAQDLTDGMRVSAELAGEDLLDALRAAPATEYLVVEQSGEIYGVLSAADVERAFVKAMARPS